MADIREAEEKASDFEIPIGALSGGYQKRIVTVALAIVEVKR